MLKDKLVENIINLTGLENTLILRLKIEAKLSEILNYLNRDELDEIILPSVSTVIADCLSNDTKLDNVQSLSEGDMSISFSTVSPYFGRLEAFKVVRGIKHDEEG